MIIASSAKLCFVDQFSVHHKLVSKYCEVIYITHMTPSPPPSVSHTNPDSEDNLNISPSRAVLVQMLSTRHQGELYNPAHNMFRVQRLMAFRMGAQQP